MIVGCHLTTSNFNANAFDTLEAAKTHLIQMLANEINKSQWQIDRMPPI